MADSAGESSVASARPGLPEVGVPLAQRLLSSAAPEGQRLIRRDFPPIAVFLDDAGTVHACGRAFTGGNSYFRRSLNTLVRRRDERRPWCTLNRTG